MSAENGPQSIEAPTLEEKSSDLLYFGIKNLYAGIFDLTTLKQRKEIGQHYTWINKDGQYKCHRTYPLKGIYNNWRTTIYPDEAYDLADEVLLSEAGLVRDTLFFHGYYENFNQQVDEFRTSDRKKQAMDVRALANMINMQLKYEVLGPERFEQEMIDAKSLHKGAVEIIDSQGDLVRNGEWRFLRIMNHLQRSLNTIKKDPRTKSYYIEAVNLLAERTNKKLHRLGIEKGIAEIVAGLTVGPSIVGIIAEAEGIRLEESNPITSSIGAALRAAPITVYQTGVISRPQEPTPPSNDYHSGIVTIHREGDHFIFNGEQLSKDEALEQLWIYSTDKRINTQTLNKGLEFITPYNPSEVNNKEEPALEPVVPVATPEPPVQEVIPPQPLKPVDPSVTLSTFIFRDKPIELKITRTKTGLFRTSYFDKRGGLVYGPYLDGENLGKFITTHFEVKFYADMEVLRSFMK